MTVRRALGDAELLQLSVADTAIEFDHVVTLFEADCESEVVKDAASVAVGVGSGSRVSVCVDAALKLEVCDGVFGGMMEFDVDNVLDSDGAMFVKEAEWLGVGGGVMVFVTDHSAVWEAVADTVWVVLRVSDDMKEMVRESITVLVAVSTNDLVVKRF